MKISRSVIRKCEFCNKEFKVFASFLLGVKGRGRFCSKACKYFKMMKDVSRQCKTCGSMLYARQKIFCSRECRPPWNKGVKGKQTAWNKGKIFPDFQKEFSSNWKGGVTPEYRKVRNSFKYKEWRKAIFERDNYTCVFCKKVGGMLAADHIKPFAFFKESRFDLDNGRTLCRKCHLKTETYGRKALNFV